MWTQAGLTIRAVLRDRIFHAVLSVGALLLILVPVFSSFSMRQVQESAIGLALSSVSLVLLVLATQLGASAVFRDIDRRYTHSVLSLPITRGQYIVGRFAGLAVFLWACLAFLALCSVIVILIAASSYPAQQPVDWSAVICAYVGLGLKYMLLAAFALFFSTFSTSFSLPFFCTIAVYLAGSASQEVYEYLTGAFGDKLPWIARLTSKVVYYLCPNFSSFDLQLQAVYGLPVDDLQFVVSIAYGLLYTAIMVWLSVLTFSRRELP